MMRAIKVDTSNVLFIKPQGSNGGKFTVLDNDLSLTIPQQDVARAQSPVISYTNASTGVSNYISCLLMQNGEIKYYIGKLGALDSASKASGQFYLPVNSRGIPNGEYTLMVFNDVNIDVYEKIYTDFCSKPVEMTLTVENGYGTVRNIDDSSEDSKLEINEGITTVPGGLSGTAFNSTNAIKAELDRVIAQQSGYSSANTAYYNVKLMVSRDGGGTWTEVTKDNFPAEGVIVIMDCPADTGTATHDFVVAHMFTATVNGHQPGEVETPVATKTDTGKLQFTLNGCSPIAIGWKELGSFEAGGNYYDALEAAATAVSAGGTITMIRDVAITADSDIVLDVNKAYTIDLGGNTLTSSGGASLAIEAGMVTVKNGKVNMTFEDAVGILVTGGSVTLEDLTVSAVTGDESTGVIVDGGAVSILGGDYQGGEDAVYCPAGSVTITAGRFKTIDGSKYDTACLVAELFGKIVLVQGSSADVANWLNGAQEVTVTMAHNF